MCDSGLIMLWLQFYRCVVDIWTMRGEAYFCDSGRMVVEVPIVVECDTGEVVLWFQLMVCSGVCGRCGLFV